jgi:hypothetical protein
MNQNVFSTSRNAAPARITAGAPPRKRSRRQIPACLFLERFTLEQRSVVISRFLACPATVPCNGLLDRMQPEDLVWSVRRNCCSTIAEHESWDAKMRSQFREHNECLRSLRDCLDKYPAEAAAFAQLTLDTVRYREICQSEGVSTP